MAPEQRQALVEICRRVCARFARRVSAGFEREGTEVAAIHAGGWASLAADLEIGEHSVMEELERAIDEAAAEG